MSKLFVMVGLPASGKSYEANRISKEEDAYVVSSDAIRAELWGSEEVQGDNSIIFDEVYKRVKDFLTEKKNVVLDATNLSSNRRRALLQDLKKTKCETICVVMATPIKTCYERNSTRDRKVPEEVIDRMWKGFEFPGYFEGWDKIAICRTGGAEDINEILDKCVDFDQENSNHSHKLFNHQYKVYESIENPVIAYTGLIHDIGKLYTKGAPNKYGNATYYSHYNVGAYEAMCSLAKTFDDEMLVYICTLIQWHMKPYFFKSDKTADKYRRIWGDELYNDIMTLHEADKAAR